MIWQASFPMSEEDGYTADVMIERGVLEQNTAFLSKPFTRDELARKMRAVLETRQQPWSVK